eukprot:SAG22_NODE_1139_length_5389_cov_1.755577_6_plen_168_part_00
MRFHNKQQYDSGAFEATAGAVATVKIQGCDRFGNNATTDEAEFELYAEYLMRLDYDCNRPPDSGIYVNFTEPAAYLGGQDPGRYAVEYTATLSGLYHFTVAINGSTLSHWSNTSVSHADEIGYAQTEIFASGQGLNATDAAAPASFTIRTRDRCVMTVGPTHLIILC